MAGLDPRDPRSREQDEIPRIPPPPVPPPQRSEEELTERYGPPAPEPQWGKVKSPFNREKFLLYLVAWILGVQFSLLILAGLICGYGQYLNFSRKGVDEKIPGACPGILDKIKDSAAESLGILLALLGGGAVAVGEYQRRRDPRDPG